MGRSRLPRGPRLPCGNCASRILIDRAPSCCGKGPTIFHSAPPRPEYSNSRPSIPLQPLIPPPGGTILARRPSSAVECRSARVGSICQARCGRFSYRLTRSPLSTFITTASGVFVPGSDLRLEPATICAVERVTRQLANSLWISLSATWEPSSELPRKYRQKATTAVARPYPETTTHPSPNRLDRFVYDASDPIAIRDPSTSIPMTPLAPPAAGPAKKLPGGRY